MPVLQLACAAVQGPWTPSALSRSLLLTLGMALLACAEHSLLAQFDVHPMGRLRGSRASRMSTLLCQKDIDDEDVVHLSALPSCALYRQH